MKKPTKKQQLMLEYRPFALSLANKFITKYELEYYQDDLRSISMVGLCKAAQRWNKKKAASFPTFANIFITGAMIDEFYKITTQSRRNNIAIQEEEIEAFRFYSLDDDVSDDGDNDVVSLKDRIPSDDLPLEDVLDKEQSKERLKQAIEELPQLERIIISLFLMNEYITYKEIGDVVGYTEGRISQLIKKIKAQLKETLSA